MTPMKKAGTALLISAVVGGGTAAGFGIASATSTPSSMPAAASADDTMQLLTDPAATSDPKTRHGLRMIFAKRVEHGEAVVKGKDGKPVTVVGQRGQVTAVSATSLTVKSEDGYTASYPLTADTRVRLGGEKKAVSDLKTGATVGVVATKSGSTLTTVGVVSR